MANNKSKPAITTLLEKIGPVPLVLVGMMGAGKTSVGRRLATHMGRKFLDSDLEIEAAAGMSIEDFFATHGEADFRVGETKVIQRLLGESNIVLATGGGAFINPLTRDIIKKQSVCVWIRADFDLLFARVSRKSNRPLLQTPNPKQTLKNLIDARYPIYQKADVIITSRDVPHETVVNDIIEGLNVYFQKTGRTK
ncbi:MAG: shikimate kinase [Devosiaceae bacterium]|nr:shikimate kinase [Devosiaceae bacterium]